MDTYYTLYVLLVGVCGGIYNFLKNGMHVRTCSGIAHATGIGTCSTIGTFSRHWHMQPPMAYAAYTAHCTYATNVHIRTSDCTCSMPGMSFKFAKNILSYTLYDLNLN